MDLLGCSERSPYKSASRLRKIGVNFALLLSFYVGSYALLSACGSYRGRPSGEMRYGFGLAVTDLSLWCPAGMIWERRKSIDGEYVIDADLAGWFYYPLIQLDRTWFHPTENYFDPPG